MRPDNTLENKRRTHEAVTDVLERYERLRDEFVAFMDTRECYEEGAAHPELRRFATRFEKIAEEATNTLGVVVGEEPPHWEEEARRIYREEGKLQAALFVRGYVGNLVLAKQWLEGKINVGTEEE